MTLAPRAAAVRGDDYQHAIGWYYACCALNDEDIASVTIEDKSGGSFDDVVVRHRAGPDKYIQAKSSTSNGVVVDEKWLTTVPTKNGKSPLQHFFATWQSLQEAGEPFEIHLVTHRGYDANHGLLGKPLDHKSNRISVETVAAASDGSAVGKARNAWVEHLATDMATLLDFLGDMQWRSAGSESAWDEMARGEMRLAGLRDDEEALTIGKATVRGWVTDASGTQSVDDIRELAVARGLYAKTATLTLAIHGIDRVVLRTPAHVALDWLDLYDGDEPDTRRRLKDPADWTSKIVPDLRDAEKALKAYCVPRVRVAAAMRLPMWFLVGHAFAEVRQWQLEMQQKDETWATDAPFSGDATVRRMKDETIAATGGLAVGISLTHDVTAELQVHVSEPDVGIGRMIVLGPDGGPGQHAVTSAGWARAWTRAARETAYKAVVDSRAEFVHLYIAAPSGGAMMLGHYWNLMPRTTIFEHVRPGYVATASIG
jgi:hypothetical protein